MDTYYVNYKKGNLMVSKIMLSALFLGSILCFYLGWANEWSLSHIIGLFDNLFVMIVLGMMVVIFGFATYWMLFKLDINKPALILETDGFIDNVGLLKGHKFKYSEIDRFEEKKVQMNRAILVFFKDPEGFIDQQTGIKKKLMKSSYTQMGTPISYPARGFETSLEEILGEFNKRLTNSRN